MSIGELIKAGITAGKDNAAIVAEVHAKFPQAQTKAASVAWYRSQMKKGTPSNVMKAKAPKATPLAAAIAKASNPTAFVEGVGFVPAPTWEVRNLKATMGKEGPGFIVTLFHCGVRVAEVSDYGDGGETHFLWADHKATKVDINTVDYKGDPHTYKGSPEEAAFVAYCDAQPKWSTKEVLGTKDDTEMRVTPDLMASRLVEDLELKRKLKRMLKKIVFIEGDELYTLKGEPTATNLAQAKHKYPLATQWLNEMTEEEALAAIKKTM